VLPTGKTVYEETHQKVALAYEVGQASAAPVGLLKDFLQRQIETRKARTLEGIAALLVVIAIELGALILVEMFK
jgi:hypothetical protein